MTIDSQWKDGKANGEGVVTLADGSKYIGKIMDDRLHGKGIYRYADGMIYDGEWENSNFVSGTLTNPDGSKYFGEFMENKIYDGVQYDKNGNPVAKFYEGKNYTD